MSGHSKWSTIKRQKGAADAKRSTTFTKLANMITIAAREGGSDASANFKLRLAIEKAREANMPKDNIDRAIKRGTGELGGQALETLVYEAYAPGGSAILIYVTTDNRNRAIANIRTLLTKYNGKLAESGAVSYLFQPRGVITVSGAVADMLEMSVFESGAEDYIANTDGSFTVYTSPKAVSQVAKYFEDQGLTASDVELTMEPVTTVQITDAKMAQTLVNLMERLEELDDVTSVYTNFDVLDNII